MNKREFTKSDLTEEHFETRLNLVKSYTDKLNILKSDNNMGHTTEGQQRTELTEEELFKQRYDHISELEINVIQPVSLFASNVLLFR